MKRKVIPVVILVIAATAAYWYYSRRHHQTEGAIEASGTVEATEAVLGFATGGRITEVRVREGDRVTAGQVLARLDTLVTTAHLLQARAQVDAAKASLLEMERGTRIEELEQARAELESAEHTLTDAETELQRTKGLAASKVVSQQQLDRAQVTYDVSKARRDQASAQLRMLEAGPRVEKIAAQRAQVAMAEAQVKSLEATLSDEIIKAPFDAIVTTRHHEPGEAVAANAPVLSLMNPGDRWVRIYIPEPRIGAVRLSSPATIRTDTYPDKRYKGEIYWVADEAEFTPRNVQTTEERVKLVYAAKVRVLADSALELKPGMPADVYLQ
jgi:HlyD family secretion protein